MMTLLFPFRFAFPLISLLWGTASLALGKVDPPPPPSISSFVLQVAPNAKAEYCGDISIGKAILYLFAITRQAQTGFILIRSQPGVHPTLERADTTLSPDDGASILDQNIQAAVSILVRPRETEGRVSAIGTRIDEIIGPLANFRLRTNSSLEILQDLRTSNTYTLDPEKAPPGAIIVSPTKVLPTGQVALGHAGILGFHGVIFSADARFGGAWARNYTLKRWENEFSAANGTYAFVLRITPKTSPEGQATGLGLNAD